MFEYIKFLPERIKRITTSGKLIREIDGLRFIAILPVLAQHMTERFERDTSLTFGPDVESNPLWYIAHRGNIGVFIFFVISGFVLALPFASHHLNKSNPVNLKKYYWRRVTRLEPPYLISLTLFFLLVLIKDGNFIELFQHYLASFFYMHNFIFGKFSPINPPIWTLEIEIQFYILAPFLAYIFFSVANIVTRRILNFILIFGIIFLQQYLGLFKAPHIGSYLHYFFIGFYLADIFLTEWKDGLTKSLFWDITGIISLVAIWLSWSWDFELHNRLIFAVSLFIFFYSVFKSVYVNKFFTNIWIMATGGMVYTIYLIHLPISEALIIFTKHLTVTDSYTINFLIQLLIFLPIVFVCSVIFYLLIEQPCMDRDWPKKFSSWIRSKFRPEIQRNE